MLSPCVLHEGYVNPDGYGQLKRDGRSYKAHRWAYMQARGPIPQGMEVDHLCRNRACVNPDHLEVVTHQENVRRAKAAMTHCVRGHKYTPENTYLRPSGDRDCRVCIRDRIARYRSRKAANCA